MSGFYILNVAAKRGLPRLNVQIGGLRVVPNSRFYVTPTDLQTHREEIEKYLQTGAIEIRYSDSADPVPGSAILDLLKPSAEEPPVTDPTPVVVSRTPTPQGSADDDKSPPSVKDLLLMGAPASPAEIEPEPAPVITLPTPVAPEDPEPEAVETPPTPEPAPEPEPEPEPEPPADPVLNDPIFAADDSPSVASMDDTSPVAVLPSFSIPEEPVEKEEAPAVVEKSKKAKSRRRGS